LFKHSKITLRFITIIFLSVFAVTFILIPDDSFARQRDKRRGDSPGVTRQGGKGRGDSPRVTRQGGKGRGDSPRVTRQGGKGRGDSPRVTRQRGKARGVSPRGTHRRGRRRVISPRVSRRGHVVPRLPRGYRRTWRKRDAYYYNRGIFYRRGSSGYIVIGAPVGAVVVSLPVGYRRMWVGDAWYYAYGGVFYRRGPSGYVVVEAPAAVDVQYDAPVLVQPSETVTGEVSVTVDILNVRTGPGLRHPVIYQIHEGYILEIHGKANGWLYVQLPNGEFGWVMTAFTTRQAPPGSG